MRTVRAKSTDFKVREENNKKYFSGYFSVFDSNYEICDGMSESIDPHAFDNAIDDDIRCLADHDTRIVLGRTKAGTLKLRIDGHGLWGDCEVNEKDQDAMNLYERVLRGDVDGCSFGFDILDEDIEQKDGRTHWTIKSVKLYEVSICTFPAYQATQVDARKQDLSTVEKRKWKTQQSELLARLEKLKGE